MSLLTIGCAVKPELVACEELTCPSDSTCHIASDNTPRCIDPAVATLCSNIADGEGCAFQGTRGVCDQGACLLARCGNGIREPGEACDRADFGALTCADSGYRAGELTCSEFCQIDIFACQGQCGDGVIESEFDEQCDDGNVLSGDGCPFDCKSDETCGNGIVDFAAGESCDDNMSRGLSADTCSSGCQRETYLWSEKQPLAAFPQVRYGAMTAYDPNLGKLVMFGGTNTSDSYNLQRGHYNDTWLFDGVSWTIVPNAASEELSPRFGAFMEYIPAIGKVVLHGGRDNGGNANFDSWAFDGTRWSSIPTVNNGYALVGSAFTFDRNLGKFLVHGGQLIEAPFNDETNETWTFDGTNWEQLVQPSAPLAGGHAMVFDPRLGKTVMFGGYVSEGIGVSYYRNPTNHTWTFDGSNWLQVPNAAPPELTPRHGHVMFFDEERQRTILFGGFDEVNANNDTWEFDGEHWTPVPAMPPAALTARAYGSTMLLPLYNKRVMVSPGATSNEIYTFADSSWSQVPTSSVVAPTIDTYRNKDIVYFPLLGKNMMFDGQTRNTWVLSGTGATLIPNAAPPHMVARRAHSMAYHPGLRKIILFGGAGNGFTDLKDTWAFDGTSWQEIPNAAPLAMRGRSEAAMAYDPVGDRIIVLGGRYNSTPPITADTWAFDGEHWTLLSAATESDDQQSRAGAALVFDPMSQRMLAFGGYNSTGCICDSGYMPFHNTLALQDNEWIVVESTPPAGHTGETPMLFNDVLRQRAVMLSPKDKLLWAWNGITWEKSPEGLPANVSDGIAVYDPRSGGIAIYAGTTYQSATLASSLSVSDSENALRENCSQRADADGDGLDAFDDPDCYYVFRPFCPPFSSCDTTPGLAAPNAGLLATQPHCGDSQCNRALETTSNCPVDCVACGDGMCSLGKETAASCPGDCAL